MPPSSFAIPIRALGSAGKAGISRSHGTPHSRAIATSTTSSHQSNLASSIPSLIARSRPLSRSFYSPIIRSTASYSDSSNGARMTTSASLPASSVASASAASSPTSAAAPRRPVRPFRAGIVGFLTGSVLAGIVTYFYILKEYRISNELLMGDIYSLQAAVQRTEAYVRTLEDRVDSNKKKNRLGD